MGTVQGVQKGMVLVGQEEMVFEGQQDRIQGGSGGYGMGGLGGYSIGELRGLGTGGSGGQSIGGVLEGHGPRRSGGHGAWRSGGHAVRRLGGYSTGGVRKAQKFFTYAEWCREAVMAELHTGGSEGRVCVDAHTAVSGTLQSYFGGFPRPAAAHMQGAGLSLQAGIG